MKIQNSVLYSPSFPTLYDVDEAEAAAAIAAGPRTYWTGVRAAEFQAARPREGEATAESQRAVDQYY
tara:strand:+ start:288 stop:488 length:201 start_codon:yes stop_codon:yes gene_type:complete